MSVQLQLGTNTITLGPTTPRALIGRDENACELWVHDNSVSRRHAEVYLHGGQAYLRDLGSSNGVWIDMTPDDGVHNPQPIGNQPVALQPRWKIWIGQAPLGVEWQQEGGGATRMVAMTPDMLQQMMAHQQQLAGRQKPPPMADFARPAGAAAAVAAGAVAGAAAPAAGSPAAASLTQGQVPSGGHALGVDDTSMPSPAELSYRRQGSNNNGTLLIALPGDTFRNDSTIDGFLEFTATDNETVASIFIELVEKHKKGPRKGHVWDRHLVRQGPWKAKKGDVLPMPFQLRVPSGPSDSGPLCHWELHGYVDIAWAVDIEATIPINMRNSDVEKIRDALGSLDYRVNQLDAKPLGQKWIGKFNPPAHMTKQLNITDINLDIEYLGSNLKVKMVVEKNKLFNFDKKREFVFDLNKLRTVDRDEVARHLQSEINAMMA